MFAAYVGLQSVIVIFPNHTHLLFNIWGYTQLEKKNIGVKKDTIELGQIG